MTNARLFVDAALSPGEELSLEGEHANYAGRVLRCRVGSVITIFNGDGRDFPATVVTLGRKRVVVALGEPATPAVESPLRIRLVQGISKGDRMDVVVQKATELGVQRITPVLTEFSVVRLDAARADKRRQHWQGVARSACEQCGRTRLPVIDPVSSATDFLAAKPEADVERYALLPGAARPMAALPQPNGGIELLIGPEGGLSAGEREQAEAAGFIAVSLGPRILRTETAGIAAVALAQSLWGDMAQR